LAPLKTNLPKARVCRLTLQPASADIGGVCYKQSQKPLKQPKTILSKISFAQLLAKTR